MKSTAKYDYQKFKNRAKNSQKQQNKSQEKILEGDLHQEIEKEVGFIEKEDISRHQKRSIKKFLDKIRNDHNKHSSNTDRTCDLRQLLKKCFDPEVDIDDPSEKELREAQRKLNKITKGVKSQEGKIKSGTRDDYIKAWRKYHRIMKGRWKIMKHESLRKTIPNINGEQPEMLKKINGDSQFTIIENTEKYIELINSADHIRDALYISLLIEVGARPCEIHEISVESIQRQGWDDGPCAVIRVPVKKVDKPERKMLVTRSYDLLESWLQMRRRLPTNTDKLFVNHSSGSTGKKGDPTSQSNLAKKVDRAGQKIGLDINRYDLRHTSVEYWMGFTEMTEERIKEKFGWKTSQMIDLYRRIDYDKLLDARRSIDGLPREKEDHFALWECNCGQKNCPTQEKCKSCKKSRRL